LLIIHLKRFQQLKFIWVKFRKTVIFPVDELDLSSFLPLSHPLRENAPLYELYAVSNHMGGLSGGHYTAFVKHNEKKGCSQEDQWYYFDDSSCEPISKQNIMTATAYVLFYQRKDLSHLNLLPNIQGYEEEEEEEDEDEEKEQNSRISCITM